MRTGLIAKKIGMSRLFNEQGQQVPVTVLQVDKCQVVAQKTPDKNGYAALQIGIVNAKPSRLSKPMRGKFAAVKVTPKVKLAEFRVSPNNMIDIGAEITADHFVIGQYVDVSAVSIGKGFAGVIKRHGFHGGRASHGVSLSHRVPGSTGQCQDPGKVFKGKKMPGHMGRKKVTTQNLTVVDANAEEGILLVKGAVPGARGGWVYIRDAIKRKIPQNAPIPGAVKIKDEKNLSEKQNDKKNENTINNQEKSKEETIQNDSVQEKTDQINAKKNNPDEKKEPVEQKKMAEQKEKKQSKNAEKEAK